MFAKSLYEGLLVHHKVVEPTEAHHYHQEQTVVV